MKVLLSKSLVMVRASPQASSSQHKEEQQPHQPISQSHAKAFDWSGRWLKGDQYAHILKNIDLYCKQFGFQKFQYKSHPSSIYENPISNNSIIADGLIYFVKGKGVGSDFGFPRVATKKKYRWKKMNFTTDLPKKRPYVTYVVASAMKSNALQHQSELPDFRMHAVIPYAQKQQKAHNQYILCHVREVEQKKVQQQLTVKSCFVSKYPDFYKLFSYLHNLELNSKQK